MYTIGPINYRSPVIGVFVVFAFQPNSQLFTFGSLILPNNV